MGIEEITLFFATFIFFVIVIYFLKKVYHALQSRSHIRVFNMEEYLPTEEIHTLKQVFYLSMMTLFVIDIFYQLTFIGTDLFYFAIFDISLSLFAITLLKTNSVRNYILILFLMPFGSFGFFFFNISWLFVIFDILHLFVMFYMVWFLYNKFKKYTKNNGLGYTVLLLYGIIFVSFIWTSIVEKVNPLDSLAMVSNAFTSNGYAILGTSIPGKINAIFLVWSGYVLSGVGTATLTFSLISRYYNKRFDELESLIKELKDKK